MNILRFAIILALSATSWAADDDNKAGRDDKSQSQSQQDQSSSPASSAPDTKQPASQKEDKQSASTTGPEERLLAKLHETNQLEIEFGKLAQQKGQSAEVKQYGKQLEQDHQSADKKVMSIAKDKNLKLDSPAAMNDTDAKKTAEQKAALERLKKMEGRQFDQEFMKVMAEGHDHALNLIRQSKPNVRDEKIKSHLAEVEPVLEKHRSMAQGGGHGHEHGAQSKESDDGSGKSKSSTTTTEP